MKTSKASLRALSIAAALAFAAGCSDRSPKQSAVDSNLARDLALAGAQPVQPTFQDTPVAPAPVRASRAPDHNPAPIKSRASNRPIVQTPRPVVQTPAPQPAPMVVAQAAAPVPAPAPAPAQIGAGIGFGVTGGSQICSSALPGEKMAATVNSPITGSNGAVIPAGSAVVLEVASVSGGPNGDTPTINFRVKAVVINDKTYPISADVTPEGTIVKTKIANADPNADKKKVIGGAIAGAILGQIIGHNTKGTVIGAAAGAATGAAVAKSGEKWEGCLPAGSAYRITLTQPIVMS
jgi:hypothetical protein